MNSSDVFSDDVLQEAICVWYFPDLGIMQIWHEKPDNKNLPHKYITIPEMVYDILVANCTFSKMKRLYGVLK